MRILQISCSYFPATFAGTEVYLHGLNSQLLSRGHSVYVLYLGEFFEKDGPLFRTREYNYEGIPVFVVEKNVNFVDTTDLYYDRKGVLVDFFSNFLKKINVDVVNFHYFSPSDTFTFMKICKDFGLPSIITYHTSFTCLCGDMLYLGDSGCELPLNKNRCVSCFLIKKGLPKFCARFWASLPVFINKKLYAFSDFFHVLPKVTTFFQLPYLSSIRQDKLIQWLNMAKRIVVLCGWARDILLKNGVDQGKIVLLRQGIPKPPLVLRNEEKSKFTFGYIGRITRIKGLEVLLKAFSMASSQMDAHLHIYGLPEKKGEEKKYFERLFKSYNDKRISWRGRLLEQDKFQVLKNIDVLIVPSLIYETGPLVVLEAWAVGTVVIGSCLGGIKELVYPERGGLLFEAGNARELANLMLRCYNEPWLLKRLELSIPALRSIEDVADDMEELYYSLINSKNNF